MQEAFLAFWKARATFDPSRAPVRSFLLTIVHHKCIDDVRKQHRRTVREHALYDGGPRGDEDGPEEFAERSYEARIVREGLTALPENHRTVLELAYFEGLTCREIAERMATPMGTVKSRMRHGLDKLAARIAEREPAFAMQGRAARRPMPTVG